jgi:hypothetical protein
MSGQISVLDDAESISPADGHTCYLWDKHSHTTIGLGLQQMPQVLSCIPTPRVLLLDRNNLLQDKPAVSNTATGLWPVNIYEIFSVP